MDIDLDSAFARLRTLRSSIEHRPWQPGMPMERALDELAVTLRELSRAHGEIGHLREQVTALGSERDAARQGYAMLEERLAAVQKLALVGRMAAGVAHDVNNLLQVVMGRAQLLVDALSESERGDRNAREILRAGRRASSLARQLLAVPRPESRCPRTVDSHEALRDMRETLELVVSDDIALELCLDPTAGAIAIERGQLEQIILNLAMNARDAMPRGGVLSISTRPEPARDDAAEATGGHVVIAVADTGVGMDPKTRARIFEPYFTTKDEAHGTGLGLASVQCTVEHSGGWLSVQTTPGEGSRFEIHLPRASRTRSL